MTIQFPDLSHYKPVSLDGALALITKGTEGRSYVDPTFVPFRADATRRGIPFCGYHWIDTSDLTAQAANAWRVMGSTPVMWDAEAAGVTVPRLLDITAQFRALGGKPRLCYLPRWWWRDHMGSPDLRPLAAAGLALVSSAYPAAGYTEDGPGWAPYGGVTPVIWQFTDAYPFNGLRVDFNAYKGSVEQLRALFNGTPTGGTDMAETMVVVQETRAVWLSNYLERRDLHDGDEVKFHASRGVPTVTVPLALLYRYGKALADSTVVLTPEQLDELAKDVAGAIDVPSTGEIADAVNDDAAARLKD